MRRAAMLGTRPVLRGWDSTTLPALVGFVASRVGGPSLDHVAPNPVPDRGEGGSGAKRH